VTPVPTQYIVREITDGARFFAPTAGIAGQVVETYLDGTSWDVSQLGPNIGHLQGTAWIPDAGNVVLAGHVEMADGRKGIFAELDRLQIGDPITLSQGDTEHTYQVTQKFSTTPDDMTVVYPSETHRLTLITCAAYDFLSNNYEERFVVIAELVN
jgi:LPXTG-site transpeptidase (sortase) family protein